MKHGPSTSAGVNSISLTAAYSAPRLADDVVRRRPPCRRETETLTMSSSGAKTRQEQHFKKRAKNFNSEFKFPSLAPCSSTTDDWHMFSIILA